MTEGNMWTIYRVQWNFLTAVCGQTPADPEIIKIWEKTRQPRVKPPGARSIEEINAEVLASIERGEGEAPTEFSILVFQRHEGVLCFRAATIKAHIKDCARVLSAQYVAKVQGERSFSTRAINGVYPDERTYWVPLLRPDGQPITKHDGEIDRPIHTRDRHGAPINALKRFEWVYPARMDFTLKVLGDSVKESDLHHIFTYGGVHGYAGERGAGEGRYEYRIERVEGKRTGTPKPGGDLQKAGANLRGRPARRVGT